MEPVDPADTADWTTTWDALVADTDPQSIDRWCSSSPWATSAKSAFNHHGELVVACSDGAGFAMATVDGAPGGALVPLESVWLFGAPIVGSDPRAASSYAAEYFFSQRREQAIYLGGYREDSPWWEALIGSFGPYADLFGGEERSRCRASLDGGIDGYLSRRTRTFRRNLRQGERRASNAGIHVDIVDTVDATLLLDRLHRIERNSWKGLDGSGIEGHDMATLYAHLLPLLSRQGSLRACVARDREGSDVGFIFGGVRGDTYRGLQISFVESARELGIGNLLQWHEIQRLAHEGLYTYDIGMDMEYKRLWTEELFVTRLLFARRAPGR